MSVELKHYLVTTPEDHVGEVAGELSRRKAWLDGSKADAGLITISTRAPEDHMEGFDSWLRRITHGIGRVVEDADANPS